MAAQAFIISSKSPIIFCNLQFAIPYSIAVASMDSKTVAYCMVSFGKNRIKTKANETYLGAGIGLLGFPGIIEVRNSKYAV